VAELAQWIWQGVALVAVVSVCTGRARGISASMRYRIWWATLALLLALPVLAALELPGVGALLRVAVTKEETSRAGALVAETSDASWIGSSMLVGLVAWMLWTAARLYRAVGRLDAAKRACRPFPVARERQLARWKTIRNRGRRATLVTSDHVRSAGVLGLGYPRIAVAPQLVSTLTDEELDQLVIHEYAHVQRRDDIASMIQLLVRCVVGWHPAVWWIDRRLRIEREVACDDWVLTTTSAPRTYARCLTRIAGLSADTESTLVPAANRRHQLTTRVMRLLDDRRSTSIRPSVRALASATALLAVVSIGLAGSQSAVVILPSVRPATITPPVSTPEMTLSRLLEALHAPHPRSLAAAAPTAAASATVELAPDAITAAHITVANEPVAHDPSPALVTSEAPAGSPVSQTASSVGSHTALPSAAIPSSPAADKSSAATAGEEPTWIDNTYRALIIAGKATGQSVADASVNTAQAVADAGAATYRTGQKSAVKTGRFFSKLGKSLTRPF
jgi:beta-lactamase regulating signal transducer with metallopeptidase domain